VVDTRDYEEINDRMVPIPGSGNPRECDRCGRLHEVHATVRYDDGRVATVGTGCMDLGAEVGRKVAAKATRLAKLRAEVAKADRLAATAAEIWTTVCALPVPEITEDTRTYGAGLACGDAFVCCRFVRPGTADLDERRETVIRSWRENRYRELAGGIGCHCQLKHTAQALHRHLEKMEAKA
jgi:hypothetical protein